MIELEKFENNELWYDDLSQYTRETQKEKIKIIEDKLFEAGKFCGLSLEKQNGNQEKITKSELDLLANQQLKYNNLSSVTQKNLQLQERRYKLTQIRHQLKPEIINNRNELNQSSRIKIDSKIVFYSSAHFDNQSLDYETRRLKTIVLGLYKSQNIPYKLWDSETKQDYFDELQWRWFKIGCIPLVVFILFFVSCFLPILEGYLAIKIIFTVVSFVCGCLVGGKGIKNMKDRDYEGPDTYDNDNCNYPKNNFNEVSGVVKTQVTNKSQNSLSLTRKSSISTSENTANSSLIDTKSGREDIPKSGFNNINQNLIETGPPTTG